jgi:hypothetical protein
MLSVVDLDPGRVDYYLSRAKLEYLQGDGADGIWYGKGASALGLSDKVQADKFRGLFRGFLDGTKLVRSAGRVDAAHTNQRRPPAGASRSAPAKARHTRVPNRPTACRATAPLGS